MRRDIDRLHAVNIVLQSVIPDEGLLYQGPLASVTYCDSLTDAYDSYNYIN
jgi:hypothetical protein